MLSIKITEDVHTSSVFCIITEEPLQELLQESLQYGDGCFVNIKNLTVRNGKS
jgi:hypothetical protein